VNLPRQRGVLVHLLLADDEATLLNDASSFSRCAQQRLKLLSVSSVLVSGWPAGIGVLHRQGMTSSA
jgi:hypothetical protein